MTKRSDQGHISNRYAIWMTLFLLLCFQGTSKADILKLQTNLGASCPTGANLDLSKTPGHATLHHTILDSYYAAIEAINKDNHKQAFHFLNLCALHDIRCQSLLAEYYFLGRPPLKQKTFSNAILLWKYAADNGSADAQFKLALLYSNIFNMPNLYTTQQRENSTNSLLELQPNGYLNFSRLFDHYNGQDLTSLESWMTKDWADSILHRNDALAITYLYSASLAGHPGALMALAYRYEFGYGVPKSCSTASLYYLEVAKKVSKIYASSIPQAVELINFELPGKYQKHSHKHHQVDLILHEAEQGHTNMQAAVGRGSLLGIYGLKQDYAKALHFLTNAAQSNHWESVALLGYIYALGLGVPSDLDMAAEFFLKSQTEYNESLGLNGMGYVCFFGTNKHPRNYTKAYEYFRESANTKLPDAQFNLGCLYMTGTGVEKSIPTALHWFSAALMQGHTPAAFTLALIHLTGISIPSMNCETALSLLKRVASSGNWYTVNSKKAVDYEAAGRYDESAFALLKLAESGDEKAQSNLAYLLEKHSNLFKANNLEHKRIYANRFYYMAYHQESISAALKLGDFAFNGWGVDTKYYVTPLSEPMLDPEGNNISELVLLPNLIFHKKDRNYLEASEFYRSVTRQSIKNSQKWMYPYILRASHNLALMRMFGIGVNQDFDTARQELKRALLLENQESVMPIQLTLYFLYFLEMYYNSSWKKPFNWKQLHNFRLARIIILIIMILLIIRKFVSIKLKRIQRNNDTLDIH